MKGYKVYLIDEGDDTRRATRRLLTAYGFEVETFASATHFLECLQPHWQGCVVTDLHMNALDGFDLMRALSERRSPLPVVFLTTQGNIRTSVRAMREGAEDFLTREAPPQELVKAVERAFARHARHRRKYEEQERLTRRFALLTPREHEVLARVAQGRMNKQIAADLGIHERTVKLHRAAGLRKLGVGTVAELSILWHRFHQS